MQYPKSFAWKASAVVLLLIMVAGCANRQSSPPPNPVIGQPSQPAVSGTPPVSTAAPRPNFYDFSDVPVPFELSRVDKDSFVFQSGSLKAGLLTLRGTRVETGSLINFFQMAMPREGWKPKGGFHSARTVLIFEKPDRTAVVNIYEKVLRSYVEIYVAPHQAM